MTDSAVLDTILGLIFLFYALALLCGGLVEMIANWVKKRAKYLLRGISDLLDDVQDEATAVPEDNAWGRMQDNVRDALRDGSYEQQRYDQMLTAPLPTAPREPAEITPGAVVRPDQPLHRTEITVGDVMGHALVQPFRHATSLGKPTRNPAYLPSSVFARTIVDLLTPGDSMEPTLADLESGIRALEHSPNLQQSLVGILKSAKGDVEGFVGGLQVWFDRQMDGVTGSYKRWAKRWVIIIAIVVVCAGNLDSIAIARALYTSGAVRAAVVQQATDFCSTPDDQAQCAVEARNVLESTSIPLGWSAPQPQDGIWGWPLKVLGLLLSIGAATLGAPFWYRLLDRVGTLRNTGRPPNSDS